jgi:hypothetical protein
VDGVCAEMFCAGTEKTKDKIKSKNAGTIFIVLRSYRCRTKLAII